MTPAGAGTSGTRSGGLQPFAPVQTSQAFQQLGVDPAAMMRTLAAAAAAPQTGAMAARPAAPIQPPHPSTPPSPTGTGGQPGMTGQTITDTLPPQGSLPNLNGTGLPQPGSGTVQNGTIQGPPAQPTAVTEAQLQGLFEADPRFLAANPQWAAERNRLMAYYGYAPDGNGGWKVDSTNPYSVNQTLENQRQQQQANAVNNANARGALFSGATAVGAQRARNAYERNLYDSTNSFLGQLSGLQSQRHALFTSIYGDLLARAAELGRPRDISTVTPTPGTGGQIAGPGGSGHVVNNPTIQNQRPAPTGGTGNKGAGATGGTSVPPNTPGQTAQSRRIDQSFREVQTVAKKNPALALQKLYDLIAANRGQIDPTTLKAMQTLAAKLRKAA